MVEMSPVMRAPAKAGAQSPERNACGSGSPLSRGYWADGPSSEHHHRSGRVALAQFVERVVDPLKRQPLGDDRAAIEEAAEVKVDQAWNLDRKADRKSDGQGKGRSGRLELGGRGIIKKT